MSKKTENLWKKFYKFSGKIAELDVNFILGKIQYKDYKQKRKKMKKEFSTF